MISNILTALLKNKWVWIGLAVVLVGYYVYGVIQENRELRVQNEMRRQNEFALKDSVEKMKDSIQVLAVKVIDITDETGEWKGKYVALTTKYQLALSTIEVTKREADSLRVIGDSLVTVSFSGREGIASYNGRTEANIKTREKSYSLKLSFSDIETESALFYDEADSLWKIRTLSLTPGVKLRGLSVVDDDTYRKIRGLKPIIKTTPHTIGIGGLATYDRVYGGVVFSHSHWTFSVHYKVFEKYLEDERWSEKLMIGVHYYIW